MAFIYDVFRIKRKAIKTNNLVIYIEDFVYWVIAALIMFAVIYFSNEGEIRGYIFIGTLIGVVLYILVFSKFVMKSSMHVIRAVYKVLRVIRAILTYPFKVIFKILGIPAGVLARILAGSAKKMRRIGRNGLFRAAIWSRMLKNIRKKI